MGRCSDLDGKVCAVFHLAQPWQAFVSILLGGQRCVVVQLKLQALIVIQ